MNTTIKETEMKDRKVVTFHTMDIRNATTIFTADVFTLYFQDTRRKRKPWQYHKVLCWDSQY